MTYEQGSALETVLEGVTGLIFEKQSTVSVIEAVQRFERDADSFRVEDLLHNAQRFSKARFLQEFREFVEDPVMSF